jgi:hypothetical protein
LPNTFKAVNAPRDQRTRLATSAVNQDISPEIAPTLPLRALDVEAVDSLLAAVVVVDKSATRYAEWRLLETLLTLHSAQRSATSHVTAQKVVPVDMVVVDTAVDKHMVADKDMVVDVKEDKPATLAVVTDICLVCIPSHTLNLSNNS